MAKRFFSKHALNVFSLELDKWEFPLHSHNFYELIFIEKGSGSHTVNEIPLDYQKGDIFLLTPRDEHRFDIAEKTVFTFVKFTEQLFVEKTENSAKGKWQRKIDSVLCNPNSQPDSIVSEKEESEKLFSMLSLLRNEYENSDFFSRQVVLNLFGAMIAVIVRNLNERNSVLSKKETDEMDKINLILGHIRQHIFEKEMLTINALADKFHLSQNYVGIYIKKHTGSSLQSIILDIKFKTAERLLCSSNIPLKEISNRLGFVDSSHFSTMFKKHNGNTPSSYRKINKR